MSINYSPSMLLKGIRSDFLKAAMGAPQNYISMIASLINSTADSEKYGWLGEAAQMQEVEDEINFDSMTDTNYTIPNVEYAAGLEVKTKDLNDDQAGGLQMRVSQLASTAMAHPNKLLMELLTNGDVGLGYDGVAFFSNTHTARKNSGVIDNLLAASGTSTANMQTDIAAAYAFFGKVLAENGEPFFGNGITEMTICAPWALRKGLVEAIDAKMISNTDNVQVAGTSIRLILDARLDADNVGDFYALATGNPLKPLIFQSREPLRFEALQTGDDAFTRNVYKYKAQARYAGGYGPFQAACKFQ